MWVCVCGGVHVEDGGQLSESLFFHKGPGNGIQAVRCDSGRPHPQPSSWPYTFDL